MLPAILLLRRLPGLRAGLSKVCRPGSGARVARLVLLGPIGQEGQELPLSKDGRRRSFLRHPQEVNGRNCLEWRQMHRVTVEGCLVFPLPMTSRHTGVGCLCRGHLGSGRALLRRSAGTGTATGTWSPRQPRTFRSLCTHSPVLSA